MNKQHDYTTLHFHSVTTLFQSHHTHPASYNRILYYQLNTIKEYFLKYTESVDFRPFCKKYLTAGKLLQQRCHISDVMF